MKRQAVTQWDVDLRIPLGRKTVSVQRIYCKPPVPGWSHRSRRLRGSHSCNRFELHFIPSGYGLVKLEGVTYPLSPGTIYVTGSGVNYELVADKEQPMTEFRLCASFNRSKRKPGNEDASTRDEIEGLTEALGESGFWIGSDEGDIIEQCQAVRDELNGVKIGRDAMVQTLVARVLIMTIRQMTGQAAPGQAAPGQTTTDGSLPVIIPNDARRSLLDNYFNEPASSSSPHQLAGLIGVSERQLERIVMCYYGLTFTSKMAQSRIARVKGLLLRTELPLRTIAERAGYATQAYMYRQFKAVTGETPGGFRKRNRLVGFGQA